MVSHTYIYIYTNFSYGLVAFVWHEVSGNDRSEWTWKEGIIYICQIRIAIFLFFYIKSESKSEHSSVVNI